MAKIGVEIRVITTNDGQNFETINILKNAKSQNLALRVTGAEADKESGQPKISRPNMYLIDGSIAFTGPANLAMKDLYFDSKPLDLLQTQNDVQQLEVEFLKLWARSEKDNTIDDQKLECLNRNTGNREINGQSSCYVCGRAISISKSIRCTICGEIVCMLCIKSRGLIRKEKICSFCKAKLAT
jgi:hypothetical protein